MRRGLLLGKLMLGQNLARPRDHLIRKSSELRDLNAVASIGRARLDSAQKGDASASLLYRYVKILYAFQLLGQFRQLKVVGRKQSLRPNPPMKIFHRRPRDRQTV